MESKVKPTIRLAVRDWDAMTPLALGDITSERLDLRLDRVAALPEDLATDPNYDASETSLSRYTTARARGETAVVGVPNFIMRAFRHRCVITARARRPARANTSPGALLQMVV